MIVYHSQYPDVVPEGQRPPLGPALCMTDWCGGHLVMSPMAVGVCISAAELAPRVKVNSDCRQLKVCVYVQVSACNIEL